MPKILKYIGTVERGVKRGQVLGFPTANIPLTDREISGIYAGRVKVGTFTYESAVFADQKRNVLEAYLLDFTGDLYGKELTIELHQKIRETGEFVDDDTLKKQIADDVAKTREYFQTL